jgi:hypothetical protein
MGEREGEVRWRNSPQVRRNRRQNFAMQWRSSVGDGGRALLRVESGARSLATGELRQAGRTTAHSSGECAEAK